MASTTSSSGWICGSRDLNRPRRGPGGSSASVLALLYLPAHVHVGGCVCACARMCVCVGARGLETGDKVCLAMEGGGEGTRAE